MYAVMPSLFVDVAFGEYANVLYNILRHVGVIIHEQLEVGALNTNFDVCRRARGEPKYVVGATVWMCSCKAAGSE
jgi:hypothetical protein